MKVKKLAEVKQKKSKELEKLLGKRRHELAKSQVESVSGKEKNIKKPKLIKRDIAQIQTVLREKQMISQAGNEEKK
jgi:ribosomal protein L29